MTVRILFARACDRCQKPFTEQSIKYGESIPTVERPEFQVTRGGQSLARFEDLCPDCEKVVEGLVRRIRMEPTERKAKESAPAADPEPAPPAPPPPPASTESEEGRQSEPPPAPASKSPKGAKDTPPEAPDAKGEAKLTHPF